MWEPPRRFVMAWQISGQWDVRRTGLVERTIRGREHWLCLRPEPLRDAARWLEHYRAFWDMRLDALGISHPEAA